MIVALVGASQFYQYREMEREQNEFLAALGHYKSGSDTNLALTALKKCVAAKMGRFRELFEQGAKRATAPGRRNTKSRRSTRDEMTVNSQPNSFEFSETDSQ